MTFDREVGPRFVRWVDGLNDQIGKVISFAFLFIMIIQVMEVVLRYLFNNPTIWAWDVNGQLFSATAILGGGYVLLHDGHVRIDLIYSRVKPRTRLAFDLIYYPLIILALVVVIWKGGEMAYSAWESKARARSYFAPLLWPVKSTLFIAGLLIFLQALCDFIRRILQASSHDVEDKKVRL